MASKLPPLPSSDSLIVKVFGEAFTLHFTAPFTDLEFPPLTSELQINNGALRIKSEGALLSFSGSIMVEN